MSKLVEILEIFNEIEFTFSCIKICETTMADAKRAMEKDSDSNELKAIYESARADKDRAETKLKGLKESFDKFMSQAKADPEFIQEIEKTTIVPERLKKAFIAVKSKLTTQKGYEKPEE